MTLEELKKTHSDINDLLGPAKFRLETLDLIARVEEVVKEMRGVEKWEGVTHIAGFPAPFIDAWADMLEGKA